MTLLILGLLLFLGVHSLRIVADDWRGAMLVRLGEARWKGLVSLLSLAGLMMIIWGYAAARQTPQVLWESPLWTRHVAAVLMLVSFVLLVAAYVPGNHLKARIHHPMVAAVKVWAFAHLLANNTLADLLLFGAFLAWAVVDFRSARRREVAANAPPPVGRTGPTLIAVVVGLLVWAGFVFWGHRALIGVAPFPAV
ncbi:MAG: NnrU family protein [Rubrivivax sp.]